MSMGQFFLIITFSSSGESLLIDYQSLCIIEWAKELMRYILMNKLVDWMNRFILFNKSDRLGFLVLWL